MEKIKIYSPNDFPDYLPKLNDLYDDLFSGGKEFRSKLIQQISKHLKLDRKTIILLSQTIEFIHNASLLHDDLIDQSNLRRGKTTAWLKYSPEYAVLAGDYLLARVIVNLCDFGQLRLVKFTGETISNLLEGEWLQDSLLNRWNLTPEELDRVHTFKTSSLFKWCLQAPFMAKGLYSKDLHNKLSEMGDILGQLFQRGDDLLDFDVRNKEGKHTLGDLKSGYLNSFATFVLKRSKKDIESWRHSSTIDELKSNLGKEFFSDCLKDFDGINEKMIERYDALNKSLKELLPSESQSLCQELALLPFLLYWRGEEK